MLNCLTVIVFTYDAIFSYSWAPLGWGTWLMIQFLPGFNILASCYQRDIPVAPPVHWYVNHRIDHVVIELVRSYYLLSSIRY
jgi:hypothetical protein